MTAFLSILAQATAPATRPAPGWAEALTSGMTPILILVLVFWFFMMRSKRNQDRQRRDMLGQMKRGDRIQTIGGILGKVVDVEDSRILVKVDESSNTKIWFSRNAIQRVIEEEKADAK